MAEQVAKCAGRPRAFGKEEALDRAMQIFWKKGFEGASISDITAALGIQPASLYAAFGSKQQLFEQALARYLAGPAAFIHEALEEPTAYGVAKRMLVRSAEFLTERRGRRGCLTIQGALACGEAGEPVRRKLIHVRVREENLLRLRFERAKADGDLGKEADAASLARFVTTVYQGMTVQAVNGASRAELLEVAEMALGALQNLAATPQKN